MSTDKKKAVNQCRIAFDYIQKLYLEVSFLIQEVEGDLGQEEEEFVIGRTGGYQIVARSSAGLESKNVEGWLRRKMSVFFVPKDMTTLGSQTSTPVDKDLKVIYMRIVLDDAGSDFKEPFVNFGVMSGIENVAGSKKFSKFENFPGYFEYNDHRIILEGEDASDFYYGDSTVAFDAKFRKVNLFDLADSDAIMSKIVVPALNLFRGKN
jgi:hypothetical protein